MAELVDAHVSGACVRKGVGVRLPLSALIIRELCMVHGSFFFAADCPIGMLSGIIRPGKIQVIVYSQLSIGSLFK
jgi:hypothetical protein